MIRWVCSTYNGSERVYDLGPRTLVIGPTGAGKTSLLASLGLALTGTADDAVGRQEVALGSDLALAMADGQDEIKITCEINEGDKISYTLPRKGRATHFGVEPSPWRHPCRAIREILAKGADAARAEMGPLLLGDEPIQVHRLVPSQIAEMVPASMTIAQIASMIETEAKDLKAMSKQRDEKERLIDNLELTLPSRPTPEAIQAARTAVTEARDAANRASEAKGRHALLVQQRQSALSELHRLHSRLAELAAEYQAVPESVPEQPVPSPAAEGPKPLSADQRTNVEAYLRIMSLAQGGQCPLCRSTADFSAARAQIEAVAEADRKAREQAPPPVLVTPSTRTKDVVAQEYNALNATYQTQQAALPADPGEAPEMPTVDVAAASRMLAVLEAAEESWTKSQTLRTELHQIRDRVTRQDLLVKELKRLLDAAYRERTIAAQDGVSRWLPKDHKMRLVLHDSSGTRKFRLALELPGGQVVYNPSGGQRSALILAIAVYLVEQQRIPVTSGPVVVMLPEERGFSAEWLGKVMQGLEDSGCQIVIASLVKPKGYRGKRWNVLNLEEAAASRAVANEAAELKLPYQDASSADVEGESDSDVGVSNGVYENDETTNGLAAAGEA